AVQQLLGPPSIIGFAKDLDLEKSLFSQATLHKVDEWLTDIWSISNDGYDNSALRKHVGKTLDHIPDWLEDHLESNEESLEPHWTETETAISKISSSKSSVGSESVSVEPASWVSAVVLFTLAKIYSLGPLTTQRFVGIIQFIGSGGLLKEAPLLSNTPPSRRLHEALKKSGHTCWSERSCGPNSFTNLYFSAYSPLLGTSDVPVVGCEERNHRTQCAACHTKCAFYDLSLALDDELLGPLQSLTDKDKKGKVKRLIIKLNYTRYQKELDGYYPHPLKGDDLEMLTKKLSSLSNLLQYALDNGKEMGILDEYDAISLGYGPKNEYPDDCDSESDPGEDTHSSSHSNPGNTAQPFQPVFTQEEDTLDLGYLESSIQGSNSIIEDNSSQAYDGNSVNLSTSTRELSQIQNISEGQTTLLHPPHPPSYPYTLPEPAHFQHPISFQPPILNQQSWTDYTAQSHSGSTRSTRSTDLLPMPHFPSQEIQNAQAGMQDSDSGDSTQHMQQINVSNGLNNPNPSLININWSSPPVLRDQTFDNSFISETGTAHNTNRTYPIYQATKTTTSRQDVYRVKKQLIFMLDLLFGKESKKIQITGGKLPWRNLFKILQEHACEFENWPAGIPEPSTQNGIEKAPQGEIKAIYKALVDKECPLRIRRIDGQLVGSADHIFISQDPLGSGGSGTKRSRDEQGSDIEEREGHFRQSLADFAPLSVTCDHAQFPQLSFVRTFKNTKFRTLFGFADFSVT
ncbi:hypothetical protein K435DRAFT_901035, partial [Dendrothele bispora CBS 962.96]